MERSGHSINPRSRDRYGSRAVPDARLPVDVTHVPLHGSGRNEQLFPCLLVRKPSFYAGEYLDFSRAERLDQIVHQAARRLVRILIRIEP